MNINLSTKKIGRLLCYIILVTSCFATWIAKSEIQYFFMMILDFVMLLQIYKNQIRIRFNIAYIFIIYLYFLFRSIHGLNIIASINASKSILLWLTVFGGVVLFFDLDEYLWCVRKIPLLLLPHTILVVLQYFAGYGVDHIGGLYGMYMGISNAGNHVLLLISSCILVALFANHEITVKKFVSGVIACLVCAAVAEIKIFLFELFILLMLYAFFTKNIGKAFKVLLLSIILIFIGIKIIVTINPYFIEFFSLEGIKNYIDASEDSGGTIYIGRTNGYKVISILLFQNIFEVAFGKGFGSEISDLANALHSTWFSYASIFIAGGIIGTVFIFMFLISLFVQGRQKIDFLIGKTVICLVVISFITFFYDSQMLVPYTSPLYFFIFAGVELMNNNEVKNDKNI